MNSYSSFSKISLNSPRKENDNRIEEISKLAQRVSCTRENETVQTQTAIPLTYTAFRRKRKNQRKGCLLNLKREIGLQVRLMKPTSIAEAKGQAVETELWLGDAQPAKILTNTKPTARFLPRPVPALRSHANTTPRAQNFNKQLVDGSKMNCHKCGKLGDLAVQCYVKPQNFKNPINPTRPPQVRMVQDEDYTAKKMNREEIEEQIHYEETAEYLQFMDDYDRYEEEETEEVTTC